MAEPMLNYLYLEYVPFVAQEQGIPWVLIAVDPADADGVLLIHEMADHEFRIAAHDREYMEALLGE